MSLLPEIPKSYLEVSAVGLLHESSIFLSGRATHNYLLNKASLFCGWASKIFAVFGYAALRNKIMVNSS